MRVCMRVRVCAFMSTITNNVCFSSQLMQQSFSRLAKALHQSTRANDTSEWLLGVNDSKWLQQLHDLLAQALKLVDHLERYVQCEYFV